MDVIPEMRAPLRADMSHRSLLPAAAYLADLVVVKPEEFLTVKTEPLPVAESAPRTETATISSSEGLVESVELPENEVDEASDEDLIEAGADSTLLEESEPTASETKKRKKKEAMGEEEYLAQLRPLLAALGLEGKIAQNAERQLNPFDSLENFNSSGIGIRMIRGELMACRAAGTGLSEVEWEMAKEVLGDATTQDEGKLSAARLSEVLKLTLKHERLEATEVILSLLKRCIPKKK